MDTALHFSGGKDSLACLYLSRAKLSEIYVIFVNTGAYYPEQLAVVESVRAMCPNFIEIKTNQRVQNERHGLPSDVVPVDFTDEGEIYTGAKGTKVQSYLRCCFENISGPAYEKTIELGCKTVIRGQRNEEDHKGPLRDGDTAGGLRFVHPVENWTRQEVLDYLKTQMTELPAHFALDHTSLDCHNCTAYLEHSLDRIQFMRALHPELNAGYLERMGALQQVLGGRTALIATLLDAAKEPL